MKECIHLTDYSTTAKAASAGVRGFTMIYKCLEGAKKRKRRNYNVKHQIDQQSSQRSHRAGYQRLIECGKSENIMKELHRVTSTNECFYTKGLVCMKSIHVNMQQCEPQP